jgi:hypothetical protein
MIDRSRRCVAERRQSKSAPGAAAQAAHAQGQGAEPAPQASEGLSDYYVRTEGTLLGEFGTFLGNLADRIDEQLQKQPGQ